MTQLLNRFGKPIDLSASITFERYQWALDVIPQVPCPLSLNNAGSFTSWAAAEGGGFGNEAVNNPLNCTIPLPGSTDVVPTGPGSFVQAYVSYEQGIQATVQTLTNGLYPGILAALASSVAPNGFASAVGNSPWGTSYDLLVEVVLEVVPIVNGYWVPVGSGDAMYFTWNNETFLANAGPDGKGYAVKLTQNGLAAVQAAANLGKIYIIPDIEAGLYNQFVLDNEKTSA